MCVMVRVWSNAPRRFKLKVMPKIENLQRGLVF